MGNSKGLCISKEIMRDNVLTNYQKFILAEIIQTILLNKKLNMTNKHFSKMHGITKSAASRILNDLIKNKYILVRNLSDEDAYQRLNKSNNKKVGCLFCGYDGIAIDEHHYPIRKKDNGTKTINLCANCHREFHNLSDGHGVNVEINWNKIKTTKEDYLLFIKEQDGLF